MKQKYKDVCERLDWHFYKSGDDCVELCKQSPAGEDFSICVDTRRFVDSVKACAADFDQDEHIEMWIEARRNGTEGVPSTRELVKDAEDINEMLRELAAAL